jgi:hypothetical protein
MGFFKSISKAVGGGAGGQLLGAAAGFGLAGPLGLTAGTGALLGAGLGGQLFADDAQVEALRRAGRIEEAARLRAEKQQQFILEQTAPFREAAREALPQLQAEVQAPIGESPLFQRGLATGRRALRAGFAGTGLGRSGAAGIAEGELVAGLTAGEIGRRQNILSGLAGFGQAGLGTGLGALQLQSGLAGRAAQTAAGIGGVQAAGQQAALSNLFQLGLLGTLGRQAPQTTLGLGGAQLPTAGFGQPTPERFGLEPLTFNPLSFNGRR